MKYKFVILLGLLLAMASCKDDVNVNIVDNETTGKLSYKLNDDAGKGIAGVKVYLLNTGTNSYPNAAIDSALTNNEGIVYFSDLLPKNYRFMTDSIMVNNNGYLLNEYVQITAGVERKKITKVSDFSGILKIRLLNAYDYTPLRNQGVVAFPLNSVKVTSDNVSDIVKQSTLKGLVNDNGYVSLRVPANTDFDFIIYHASNGNLGWGGRRHQVAKDQELKITLYSSFY